MAVAALVIALLSLLLSGFAVYIQWHQWHHGRRLQVDLRANALTHIDQHQDMTHHLQVHVTNWSSFPIKVVAMSFIGPADAFPVVYYADARVNMPAIVTPRDAETFTIPTLDLKGDVPEGPLVAWIRLATGEEFRSDPFDPGVRGLGEPLSGVDPEDAD